MKVAIGVLMAMLGLLVLAPASPASADRGMIPVSEVTVYGPGQKAIIAWNGEEEILILSTDAYASGDSTVLELLPLSSAPTAITKGDFATFVRLEEIVRDRFPLWISGGRSSPELTFVSARGACSAQEGSAATISLRDSDLLFWGVALTPTPCHQLTAQLEILATLVYPPIVMVDISSSEELGNICIQCIGEIPFKGRVRYLDPGEYDFLVVYQGQVLAQERVEVPPPSEVHPMELPAGATLEVDPAGEEMVKVNGTAVELTSSSIEVEVSALSGEYQGLTLELDEILGEVNITAEDVSARTRQAIKVEDYQLFLGTPQGWALVRAMPHDVAQVLLEQEIEDFELEVGQGRAVYAVRGTARTKLFGLMPVAVGVSTTVDAQSGKIISEKVPWWSIFCPQPPRGIGSEA